MKGSQYTEQYLDASEKYGWTIGTFLKYNLRGKAAKYTNKYRESLVKDLNRMVKEHRVVYGPSIRNSTAYYRLICNVVKCPPST